jgi:hypothetical protein
MTVLHNLAVELDFVVGQIRERALYGITYNIRQYSRLTVHGDVLLELL